MNATQAIVNARQAPRYQDSDLARLKILITSLHMMKGEKADEMSVVVNANALHRVIFEKYAGFTFEEIEIACRNGILGQYGTYYGINVVSICSFLASYKLSNERFTAINTIAPLKKLNTPGDAYNKECAKRMFEDIKKHYIETKNLPIITNAGLIIDHLLKEGKIRRETYKRYTDVEHSDNIRIMAERKVSALRKLLLDYLKTKCNG